MEIQDSSLKERGIVGAVVDAVKGIASLIQKIIEKVKAKRRAKKERTDFAKSVVDQGRKDHPEFNWVICASKHSAEFKGTKGTDWDQLEKDVQVEGKTVKFTAYYGREGEFWDKGAKASSDWAYAGSYDIDRKSKGKHLIFKRPQ
ncbi:hypothetical protein C0991_009129 [Blastosporella zonata]|nr:hypothetical protein C0991_009129 [Blastosporella zonata]